MNGHAQKTEVLEMLASIRDHMATSTEHMARVAGGIYNNVLDVFTLPIPAGGFISRDWHVSCGSVVVFNETTANIVLTTNGSGSSAPTQGTGVTVIGPRAWKAVPVASHQITIYGTTGTGMVNVQAFTGMQALVGGGAI